MSTQRRYPVVSLHKMRHIGSKKEVEIILEHAFQEFDKHGISSLLAYIRLNVLNAKIRFPLLEYIARKIYIELSESEQTQFAKEISGGREIGSYVFVGIFLQQGLPNRLSKCIEQATDYIVEGDTWYACDIISERVGGVALLRYPEEMLPILIQLAKETNQWKLRMIGVSAHYAIKKGLAHDYVDEVFQLLLSMSRLKEFYAKKGIAWAAKTTAKYHPNIIQKYDPIIYSKNTGLWFQSGVNRGVTYRKKLAH